MRHTTLVAAAAAACRCLLLLLFPRKRISCCSCIYKFSLVLLFRQWTTLAPVGRLSPSVVAMQFQNALPQATARPQPHTDS